MFKYKEKEHIVKENLGAVRHQYLFKFDNDFGASVIKGYGTHGYEDDKWELGVIHWDPYGNYHLTYETRLTDDVIGWLSVEDVNDLLDKIKEIGTQTLYELQYERKELIKTLEKLEKEIANKLKVEV